MRILQVIGGFLQVTVGTAIITIAVLMALFKALPAPPEHKIIPPKAIHTHVPPPPPDTYVVCKVQYKTSTHPHFCRTFTDPEL